jgi:uncharacterized protein (UPF0212 family)
MDCPHCDRRVKFWYLRCHVCSYKLWSMYVVIAVGAIVGLILAIKILELIYSL